MLFFFLILFCSVFSFRENLVKRINEGHYSWRAANNKLSEFSTTYLKGNLGDLSKSQIRSYLGKNKRKYARIKPKKYRKIGRYVWHPKNFDARKKWKRCRVINAIRDQSSCGSCWAFAVSSVYDNRLCINSKANMLFSPQDLVSCDTTNYGCSGGNQDRAWQWIIANGIAREICIKYDGWESDCPNTCEDGSEIKRWKPKSYYKIGEDSWTLKQRERAMEHDLIENGPFVVRILIYDDFYQYYSGVYQHTSSDTNPGSHAVRVIGYGVENGIKYWLIANSWGWNWGYEGTVKIRKGVDEIGIETRGVYACNIKKSLVVPKRRRRRRKPRRFKTYKKHTWRKNRIYQSA